MRVLLLLSLLALSNHALAKTEMSKLVEYVQNKYAAPFDKHPILVLDKDDLSFEVAKENLWGEENRNKRYELITKYIEQKRGIGISSNDASNIDTYIAQLRNSAVALPLFEGYFQNRFYKLCVVFHADPSSNTRLETERLLGLNTKEAYGEYEYHHLKGGLSFEQLQKFSLFHELGHCMDQEYLPAASQSYDDPHGTHESESFAEATGLFLLAREGIENVADGRIKMRNIYSHKMGQFFMDNPYISMGNPNLKYGGLIYYMEPVLMAGDQILKTNSDLVVDGTVDEMLATSKSLVEEHAFTSQSLHWTHTYFQEGHDHTVERLREMEEDIPSLFTGVLDKVLTFVKNTKESFENAFDLKRELRLSSTTLRAFNINEFCPALITGNKEAFFSLLQDYRDDLKSEAGSPEEQRERQTLLINIFEEAAKSCH